MNEIRRVGLRLHRQSQQCESIIVALPVSDRTCCPSASGSTEVRTLLTWFHALTQYFPQHLLIRGVNLPSS